MSDSMAWLQEEHVEAFSWVHAEESGGRGEGGDEEVGDERGTGKGKGRKRRRGNGWEGKGGEGGGRGGGNGREGEGGGGNK